MEVIRNTTVSIKYRMIHNLIPTSVQLSAFGSSSCFVTSFSRNIVSKCPPAPLGSNLILGLRNKTSRLTANAVNRVL